MSVRMSALTYPPYFCPQGYRAILSRAVSLGYWLGPFREFDDRPPKPALLLRHDLDHSLRSAVELARWESDLNVRATYFVQVACDFYNLLSSESRGLLRELTELGHEVGLHYDSRRYVEHGLEQLAQDARLLAELSGQPVESASQHIPIDSAVVDVRAIIPREAYEPRFTREPLQYISDSLMAWRQATPHELLDAGDSFQFLTHPMKWVRAFTSMDQALDYACEQETTRLRQAYESTRAHYERLLRERTRLDQEFEQRRSGAQPHLNQ